MRAIVETRALLLIIIMLSIGALYGCSGDKGDTIYTTSYDAPGTPDNVQATAGDGEVTVRWSPAGGATSYNIYWNTTGSVTTSDEAVISASSPYVQTGLTNGTTYSYVVTGVNIEGESGVSSEVTATPVDSSTASPPSAPTGVHATAGDGQVTVSWSPVTGATTYNIYWSTAGSVTTSDSAIIGAPSPYVHMGLNNGTAYSYAVTAINEEGESALSGEVTATPQSSSGTPMPPGTPANVQAAGGDGQVTISWNPVAGAISYNIYWEVNEGVTTSDSAIISASSPYAHTGLTNNTAYYYVVTAVNANGMSAESGEVSAVPRVPFSEVLQTVMANDAQTSDYFGNSVSISGDYVIVGAYYEDGGTGDPLLNAGAAYIYHRTGPDTWDTGYKIVAPDAQASDYFGQSVSISGDYAIVGAQGEDGGAGNPLFNAGAAYIYHRTGVNTWDAGTKIVASDAQASDYFGQSVSISGDYAIVGAYWEDGGAGDPLTNAGAAYIYRRTGTNTWDAGTKIMASDAQSNDYFGYSVSISGDYAIAGAYFEDGGAGDPITNAGAAYIYHRTDVNTWDTGTKIAALDAQIGDDFGRSVSISGDYVIAGAYYEDGGAGDPLANAGAAYIYHRTGTNTWDAGTKIVASDAQADDRFGCSVSISGDYAIVGAYNEDGGAGDPIINAGAAYIFHRTGVNTWDTGTKIIAPDAQTIDYFGYSVSISGDHAIVGAYFEDGGAGDPISNAGAAYIY